MKNVFCDQCFFTTNITASSKITHEFQYIWVVQLNVELFSFDVFGYMNTIEDRFRGRIVDDPSS